MIMGGAPKTELGNLMKQKIHAPEDIIRKLRKA